jgi:hypothetical protein
MEHISPHALFIVARNSLLVSVSSSGSIFHLSQAVHTLRSVHGKAKRSSVFAL